MISRAFIPPMVHVWCMHRPFVKHACIPGYSHSLHDHPGSPQDDGMTSSSCHPQLPSLPPFMPPLPPLPFSPSSLSCTETHCMPKYMPSASPAYSPCRCTACVSGAVPGLHSHSRDTTTAPLSHAWPHLNMSAHLVEWELQVSGIVYTDWVLM